MERFLVVGDIHGCLIKLEALLAGIKLDPEGDHLIFLGDYIDRGPDSWGVVERLLKLKEEFPGVIFLMGNHEQSLLDFFFRGEEEAFLANGGATTIRSYQEAVASRGQDGFLKGKTGFPLPETHLKFFLALKSYYETEEFIFVHAGLRPGTLPEEQEREDLFWIRGEFICHTGVFPKPVIFGHTVFPEPLVSPDRIGIDTGAVYGGKLTCLELPSRTIYQF